MFNNKTRVIFLIIVIAIICISIGFSDQASDRKAERSDSHQEAKILLPEIPNSALPKTGHVTEYWPCGQMKSECTYRNGEMLNGTYYASNGQLIYEMTAESSNAEIPTFPMEARPDSGKVVEYWANGNVKSESVFKAGKAVKAIFYTSEGVVAYEVSSDPDN